MLLAYSWELIEINGNCGLGEYSETGLENNNKYLRFYRQYLARKISQESNLTDCLNRFWLKSDPCICHCGPMLYCSRCNIINVHHTISCLLKKVLLLWYTLVCHYLIPTFLNYICMINL